MKRRTLLSLAAAGALAQLTPVWAAKKPKPLRILILGGTRFIGLHMTSLALQRGHRVAVKLLVADGNGAPAVQPAVGADDVRAEAVAQEIQHVLMVERLAVHRVARPRPVAPEAT